MPNNKTAKATVDRTDWAALRAMSEEEIERMAAEDEDNPATISDDEWAHATIGLPPLKAVVHATLDQDVVDFFKRGGRGYATRMNAVLRRYMEAQERKNHERS